MKYILGLAVLAVLGCQGGDPAGLRRSVLPSGATIDANAMVHFINIEGGCWVLETNSGRYEPVNLDARYRIDGLRVYVKFTDAPQNASICMVAPLVRVDEIRNW